MSIGVRGTVLDINARGPDSSVMFLSGSGTACDVGGTCIDITEICDLYVAPRGGGIVEATGLDRQQRLNVFFPFVGNQNPLNVDFRATTSCNVGNSRFFAPPEEPYSRKHEPGTAAERNSSSAAATTTTAAATSTSTAAATSTAAPAGSVAVRARGSCGSDPTISPGTRRSSPAS